MSEPPIIQHRPWGSYEVLQQEERYWIKRITVLPGQRLSRQKHGYRREQWLLDSGNGLVEIDGKETSFEEKPEPRIPPGVIHRATNTGTEPLIFYELAIGELLSEDDITRLEDDYGRVP
jgi:mannose-6-phosphate isomerase-like protein (cupin superfamily)